MDFLTDLTKVNYVLSGVHLIAGIALLLFAYRRRDRYFNFELTRGGRTYQVSSRTLVYTAAAFLFITAGFHLFYGLDWGKRYTRGAYAGRQSYRWLEYGITATIMALIIAVISGVTDVYLLVTLGALSVGIMATGLWFETVFSGMSNRFASMIPLLVGFALLLAYVYVVFMSYRDARTLYEAKNSETIPGWITWIVIGTLLFFASFGFVPLVRWFANHKPVYSEYAYMALSAIAKLYLGFFLGYGILQRTDAENAIA